MRTVGAIASPRWIWAQPGASGKSHMRRPRLPMLGISKSVVHLAPAQDRRDIDHLIDHLKVFS